MTKDEGQRIKDKGPRKNSQKPTTATSRITSHESLLTSDLGLRTSDLLPPPLLTRAFCRRVNHLIVTKVNHLARLGAGFRRADDPLLLERVNQTGRAGIANPQSALQ